MRSIERINRITDALNHLWHLVPDQRLYQLIYNIGHEPGRDVNTLYQIEDDEWLRRIENAIANMSDGTL